jgi:hypothetical protein
MAAHSKIATSISRVSRPVLLVRMGDDILDRQNPKIRRHAHMNENTNENKSDNSENKEVESMTMAAGKFDALDRLVIKRVQSILHLALISGIKLGPCADKECTKGQCAIDSTDMPDVMVTIIHAVGRLLAFEAMQGMLKHLASENTRAMLLCKTDRESLIMLSSSHGTTVSRIEDQIAKIKHLMQTSVQKDFD